MSSQGSYSSLRWSLEQGQYWQASEATFQRGFLASVFAIGFAVSVATKTPIGMAITGPITLGFGVMAVVAKCKENRLGAQLDALRQARTPFILR
jgi:hypothetical protein